MELFSGIVLAVVVLAIAVYLIKELFGEKLEVLVTEYKQKPARSPNHHLVGSSGTVISLPQGEEELLRVRIGIERWDARVKGDEHPPVGAAVRVTAVEGLVLHVEEKAPDAAADAEGAVAQGVVASAVAEGASAAEQARPVVKPHHAAPPDDMPAAGAAEADPDASRPADAQQAQARADAPSTEEAAEIAAGEPQPKTP